MQKMQNKKQNKPEGRKWKKCDTQSAKGTESKKTEVSSTACADYYFVYPNA